MDKMVKITNQYSDGFDKIDFPVAFVALLEHLNLTMICRVEGNSQYEDYFKYEFEPIKADAEGEGC